MSINTRNIALFGAGLAIGGGIGYIVGYKRAAAKYETLIDTEIESIKKVYGNISLGLVKPPLEELVKEVTTELVEGGLQGDLEEISENDRGEYNDLVKDLEYEQPLRTEGELRNIFSQPEISEDELGPVLHRNPGFPYVISMEEFMEDDKGHEKSTLVYYEEDDVLCGDDDSIIDEADTIVGFDNLHNLSEDAMYIRNERLELDMEIIRNSNSYAEVVMGVKPEKPVKRRPKKSQRDE